VTGIVCSKEPIPPQDWIDDQINASDIKILGPTNWWGILVFGGGYALSPGPLLVYLREATYEDFLAAADSARASGRLRLAKVFPTYLKRVVAEHRGRQTQR
jgi:hypothetical protein